MRNRIRAFTLVELLVVMGIIAILIAFLLPTLRRVQAQSRDAHCQANLRELFAAQTFYSEDNAKRYAGCEGNPASQWPERLKRYISRSGQFPARLQHCPTVSPETLPMAPAGTNLMSYGVNSAMALSYWQFRRDRKMNSSEIILMGDKAANYSDWLTSEDGRYLEGDSWIWSLGHRSRTTNRHGNGTRANMLMADGHVAALGRDELKLAAGHWYFGEPNLPEVPVYFGVCCGQ